MKGLEAAHEHDRVALEAAVSAANEGAYSTLDKTLYPALHLFLRLVKPTRMRAYTCCRSCSNRS